LPSRPPQLTLHKTSSTQAAKLDSRRRLFNNPLIKLRVSEFACD
jgi:hypothetical protein